MGTISEKDNMKNLKETSDHLRKLSITDVFTTEERIMIKEKVAEAVKRTEGKRYAKKRLTSKEVSDTCISEAHTKLKINCINDSNKKSTNLTNDRAKKHKRWKTGLNPD